MRQGCTISPWLFNVYMDAVIKEMKMGKGRREVRFLEEERERERVERTWSLVYRCIGSVW